MQLNDYRKLARKNSPARSVLESNWMRWCTTFCSYQIYSRTNVSPNFVTILSIFVFAVGYSLGYYYQIPAILILAFFIYTLCDNVDGELARARGVESEFGAQLEIFADHCITVISGSILLLSVYQRVELYYACILCYALGIILMSIKNFKTLSVKVKKINYEYKNYLFGSHSYFLVMPALYMLFSSYQDHVLLLIPSAYIMIHFLNLFIFSFKYITLR